MAILQIGHVFSHPVYLLVTYFVLVQLWLHLLYSTITARLKQQLWETVCCSSLSDEHIKKDKIIHMSEVETLHFWEALL